MGCDLLVPPHHYSDDGLTIGLSLRRGHSPFIEIVNCACFELAIDATHTPVHIHTNTHTHSLSLPPHAHVHTHTYSVSLSTDTRPQTITQSTRGHLW